MKARRVPGLRVRSEAFGGVVYVPERDDFFAATQPVFTVLEGVGSSWTEVVESLEPAVSALGRVGVLETMEPRIEPQAYIGPSFLGQFEELPSVRNPLLVNCFSTAHCPLRCVYCHADDLMIRFRASERWESLDNVIATARSIPALVAVITGGDPITRPKRAIHLIESLADSKSLVLDTSGVGDWDPILPALVDHNVHVRLSLDMVGGQNDWLRPVNKDYVTSEEPSRAHVEKALALCHKSGLPVTIQTVVSNRNHRADLLLQLRDWLVDLGVKHWVLHVAVEAGKARAVQKRSRRGILPRQQVYEEIWKVMRDSMDSEVPIDIRATDTDTSPNSVMLVGSEGDLFTEGLAAVGKVKLYDASSGRPDRLRDLWYHIDRFGHARRYLNWNKWFYEGRPLREICYEVPLPPTSEGRDHSVVETERKYRVTDVDGLRKALSGPLTGGAVSLQRDEYFDTDSGSLGRADYVVRIRREADTTWVALKGPRFYSVFDDVSRIELEFPGTSYGAAMAAVRARGLRRVWVAEKRRQGFTDVNGATVLQLDEIPSVGWFVELEASDRRPEWFEPLRPYLSRDPERRHYGAIIVSEVPAAQQARGVRFPDSPFADDQADDQ